MVCSSILLYSTNVKLKYDIQCRFRGNIHYVWCSENYDSRALARHAPGAGTPPTSNPAEIYEQLKAACSRQDRHDAKIVQQIAGIKARAVEWEKSAQITTTIRDEIIYLADHATFKDWQPLLYVIPSALVDSRLQVVPVALRASPVEMEFIIPDLKSDEFHILEPS
jgi:hypothetical protein